MPDKIYKTIEITGSSTQGVEDAVKQAVTKASKSVRNLRWFEITNVRGHIENDAVAHWQVTTKLGFALDD